MRAAVLVLLLSLAGCGGGAPAGPTAPATLIAGGPCAGLTPADPNNPPPSLPLTPDATLEQAFPAAVNGQQVTDVASGGWVESVCIAGGRASVEAVASALEPSLDVSSVTVASAQVVVDGEPVPLAAFRLPDGQGADLLPLLKIASAAISDSPRFAGDSQTVTVSGKTVQLWDAGSGNKATYTYASGDTLWLLDSVTESQAGQILAALS